MNPRNLLRGARGGDGTAGAGRSTTIASGGEGSADIRLLRARIETEPMCAREVR